MISILIPCYNSIKTIDKTIESVLAQTFTDVEVIIQDDCSTDGTYEYLTAKYEGVKFVKIYQNKVNLGMCGNWNELFSKANGDYLLKLDADDVLNPDFINTTHKYALATNADFVGSAYQFLDTNTQKKWSSNIHQKMVNGVIQNPLAEIFTNYPFHLCFTLMKAGFVRKISPNYYFMSTEVGDAEFQIRAALTPNFKAYFIKEELGYYCFHGNNSSLTPLKQARSFIYDVVGAHHNLLAKRLGNSYRKKILGNFKSYLKDMILRKAPWDFKLLYYCLKYAIK